MSDPAPLAALQRASETILRQTSACYLVGGALRDILLGKPSKDFDFACADDPRPYAQKVADLFGGALFALKEDQDIYRVVTEDGFQFDFAKFKGPDLAADLALRDFTANAMALPLEKVTAGFGPADFIDPHSGKKDIEERTVRMVSGRAFTDDPLRMLRAFRMSAAYGLKVHPDTLDAVRVHAQKIKNSAGERIQEELLLIFDCGDASSAIRQMDDLGVISALFPEVDPNRACADHYYPGKGVWGHCLDGLTQLEWILKNLPSEFPEDHEKIAEAVFKNIGNHKVSGLMKLAVLLHDIGKAPTAKMIDGRMRFFLHDELGARLIGDIARRLKMSSDATGALEGVVRSHMRPGGLAHMPVLSDRAKFRFFRDTGDWAIPLVLVSLADRYTYLTDEERGKQTDLHERVSKEIIRWHYELSLQELSKKPKLITGNDVMEQFQLKPGPIIGRILKDVEEAHALGEISTRDEALAFAKNCLKKYAEEKEGETK